jgi:predicted PurR-regulated permease PerM
MLKAYMTDRNVQRTFVLLVFVGLVVFFRQLLLLFVFFVVFQRTLALLGGHLARVTRLKFSHAVLIVTVALVAALGGALAGAVLVLRHHAHRLVAGVDAIIAVIRSSALYKHAHSAGMHFTADDLLAHARHHAGEAVHYAETVGRSLLYVIIAMIFSVVFLLERDDLEAWRARMPIESMPRTLLRYIGHLADAVAITLKLQVIVAIVNALVTLPILLLLRLPGIPALVAMLLITGLIPVVGGPTAGAVLMILAFVTRGPVGLIIFVASTFVLHKIESYYLNPRLTARHVKLPGFVIITSLVLFEHAFGIRGLFLSFPCLYVAAKIREGWVDPKDEIRDEDAMSEKMRDAASEAEP